MMSLMIKMIIYTFFFLIQEQWKFKLRVFIKWCYLDRNGTEAQIPAKRTRTRAATHRAININK